ncbi:uncharacterized protein TNIN_177521 [Trichonephila inaurata madagascariensis]|uniref:Uncharacterized protein n=1 Tax=Trichonephila inaurata madagascariensis TaxID=2747483 RepID=A0A8X6YQB0_9ARAC|nr:uncharacterized protein TNIN_177521 [Trichonephila inaurata madagascariensis]
MLVPEKASSTEENSSLKLSKAKRKNAKKHFGRKFKYDPALMLMGLGKRKPASGTKDFHLGERKDTFPPGIGKGNSNSRSKRSMKTQPLMLITGIRESVMTWNLQNHSLLDDKNPNGMSHDQLTYPNAAPFTKYEETERKYLNSEPSTAFGQNSSYKPQFRGAGKNIQRDSKYDPVVRYVGLGKKGSGYNSSLKYAGLGKKSFAYDPALRYMGLGKRSYNFDPALKYMGLGKKSPHYDPALNYMGLGKKSYSYDPAIKDMRLGKKSSNYDPALKYMGLGKKSSIYDPALKYMGLGKKSSSYDTALKYMVTGKKNSSYDPALKYKRLGENSSTGSYGNILRSEEKKSSYYDPALKYMGLGKKSNVYNHGTRLRYSNKKSSSFDPALRYMGLGKKSSSFDPALKYMGLGKKSSNSNPLLKHIGLDKKRSSYDPALKYMGLGKKSYVYDPALKYMGLGKRSFNYDFKYVGLGKKGVSYDPALKYMGLGKRDSSRINPTTVLKERESFDLNASFKQTIAPKQTSFRLTVGLEKNHPNTGTVVLSKTSPLEYPETILEKQADEKEKEIKKLDPFEQAMGERNLSTEKGNRENTDAPRNGHDIILLQGGESVRRNPRPIQDTTQYLKHDQVNALKKIESLPAEMCSKPCKDSSRKKRGGNDSKFRSDYGLKTEPFINDSILDDFDSLDGFKTMSPNKLKRERDNRPRYNPGWIFIGLGKRSLDQQYSNPIDPRDFRILQRDQTLLSKYYNWMEKIKDKLQKIKLDWIDPINRKNGNWISFSNFFSSEPGLKDISGNTGV